MTSKLLPPKLVNWTEGHVQIGIFVRTEEGSVIEYVNDNLDTPGARNELLKLVMPFFRPLFPVDDEKDFLKCPECKGDLSGPAEYHTKNCSHLFKSARKATAEKAFSRSRDIACDKCGALYLGIRKEELVSGLSIQCKECHHIIAPSARQVARQASRKSK